MIRSSRVVGGRAGGKASSTHAAATESTRQFESREENAPSSRSSDERGETTSARQNRGGWTLPRCLYVHGRNWSSVETYLPSTVAMQLKQELGAGSWELGRSNEPGSTESNLF